MAIGSVIQQRRKRMGFTQEQMAERLGVTAPAVNKWEKGNTCPDIQLLPPIARLLKIDLNTLFGFYEEITQQELMQVCKEIRETVASDGFEVGFAVAREKICQYPNSDQLLHSIALLLQGLLTTAGLDGDRADAYGEMIEKWYEQLAQSEDAVIRNSACFMLASRAIGDGQYERAQDYLNRMPKRNDTPDKTMLEASIHLNQGRAGEAAKLMERSLLNAVNDVQMILYRLLEANIALGDRDAAAYVAERAANLAETFDLGPYNAAVVSLQLAMADEDAGRTVEMLREMFKSLACGWRIQESPLYRRIVAGSTGASMEKMIAALLKAIKEGPEFAYLRKHEGFASLLTEFEERESND